MTFELLFRVHRSDRCARHRAQDGGVFHYLAPVSSDQRTV